MQKKLKDLNLIDNFLFNEMLLQEDQEKTKEFVRAVLEPIIQTKIGNIEIDGQKIIQGTDTDKRGIQLDAYVKVYEDDAGNAVADVSLTQKPVIYDIEPNQFRNYDENRARTYHSIIDANVIKSGTLFKDIPDVFVIFILPYDPFGLDRMLYTVKNRCIEEPNLEYDDGATTLFLYAYGTKDIPSQELANMLKYFVETTKENAEKANMSNIMDMVSFIKDDSRTEAKYMQSWEEKEYYRELGEKEGREKGRVEGKAEGKAESIRTILKKKGMREDSDIYQKISAETDIDTLNAWLDIAVEVTDVEEFILRIL